MDQFKDSKYKINIRDIRPSYIKQTIFSFLPEKQLLDMIKYNKELQSIYSIDIERFKTFSGKYTIGEKNGKGSEYLIDTKILIFEGKYLNGKKNGKGKEYYDNGKLKFEGDYLNGKKLIGTE